MKNKNTSDMFKLNILKTNMKLGNINKFREVQSKTSRLYKSALPYMTRVLNKEHKEEEKLQS